MYYCLPEENNKRDEVEWVIHLHLHEQAGARLMHEQRRRKRAREQVKYAEASEVSVKSDRRAGASTGASEASRVLSQVFTDEQ